jgi:hypothetical protein
MEMPRGDGTGPLGQGPMTGRGFGYCSGSTQPGFVAGAGLGRGRGFARCMGRGLSGFGRGFGWIGSLSYGNPQAEKSMLQNQLNALETAIAAIKNRLGSIGKESE